MNFLIDAQSPRALCALFHESGYAAVHTLDLPLQNRTSDAFINEVSVSEDRIVVTKDKDFLETHLLLGRPSRLILITTGNIRNTALFEIFEKHLNTMVQMLTDARLIEVTRSEIIGH